MDGMIGEKPRKLQSLECFHNKIEKKITFFEFMDLFEIGF